MEFESVYKQIKNDYFPRWDCNNEWQLKFVDDLHGAQASCSSELKTITLVNDYFIHPSASKINELKVILIHEIHTLQLLVSTVKNGLRKWRKPQRGPTSLAR